MMKKIKIHILLIFIVFGNVVPLHGMAGASRAGASKGQAYARKKFSSNSLSGSLWSKLSAYASQLWKILSNPKVHYPRVGHLEKEAGKKGQQEASKLDGLDQEEEKVEKEDQEESEIEEGNL